MWRWLVFPIGYLVQCLYFLLYPIAVFYFWFWGRKLKSENYPELKNLKSAGLLKPTRGLAELILADDNKLRDSFYLDDDDTHTAIVHSNLWGCPQYRQLTFFGLRNLVDDSGYVHRVFPVRRREPTSGDCLSSWVFAYVVGSNRDVDSVRRIAWHYLKNCFGFRDIYEQKFSARSSNGGVNFVHDGWPANKTVREAARGLRFLHPLIDRYPKIRDYRFKVGLNQPAFGPQFFTTCSILALAASETSGFEKVWWNIVYWLHFVFMGGFLHVLVPVIYFPTDLIYYSHHVTMMNLYSLAKLRGSFLYRWPMRWVSKIIAPAGNCNPYFYALSFDVGALSSIEDFQLAVDTLGSMKNPTGFRWQHSPVGESYLVGDENTDKLRFDSIFAFPAILLFNKRNKVWRMNGELG